MRSVSRFSQVLAGLLFLTLPLLASAHEHHTYVINGKTYVVTLEMLNEPVAVDDKSGVKIEISEIASKQEPGADGDSEAGGAPVLGLERSLKVNMNAGDKTKSLALEPVVGKPGSYEAIFYPTVETTYTYRVEGTIAGVAVDMAYACDPAGEGHTQDWHGTEKITDKFSMVAKRGSIGCPTAKADLGFPEPALTLEDMRAATTSRGPNWGIIGTILGTIACVFSLRALQKR